MKNNRRNTSGLMLLVAFTCLLLSSKAQLIHLTGGDTAYAGRLEFGVAMYSNDVREAGLYSSDPIPFEGHYFVNGCYFRFWNNGTAYRFAVNHFADEDGLGQYYNDASLPFFEGSGMQPTFSGIIRNALEVKGGAQFLFFNSRLSPYFTADLGYRYTSEKEYLSFTTIIGGHTQAVQKMFRSESSQFAFYGGLGMKYQLNARWVIGFETQLSLNYSVISSDMPGRKSRQGFGRGLHPGQFTLGFYL